MQQIIVKNNQHHVVERHHQFCLEQSLVVLCLTEQGESLFTTETAVEIYKQKTGRKQKTKKNPAIRSGKIKREWHFLSSFKFFGRSLLWVAVICDTVF